MVIARFAWIRLELDRKPGEHPLRRVINEENKNPLILAIKVGKRRFPVFGGIPGSSWIVLESYLKGRATS